MAYAVSINYGGGAVDLTNYTGVNLVRQDSFSRTETLYNQDRKAVVNTARFSIDMNTTLANALLTLDSDQEITCTITKDAAAWFTGYIRPVTDFTVSTGAEQIDFEAVDRLYFLQRQLGSTLAKVSTDSMVVSASGGGATSLVHALTSAISFPGTVYAADIDDEIVYFREEAGENGRTVFDILNDLLFSYHHVFYADAAGDLRMHDWSPAAITPAGTFNGANIIESLTVSRDDKDETGVAVTYYTTTTVEDKRVVNGQEYGVVFLESSDKYPPEYTDDYSEKYWHWGFDETEDLKCIGAVYASSRYFVDNVIYIIKKRLWVDADSNYSDGNGHTFTVTANTHSSATATSTFYGVGTGVGIGAYEVYADVTYKKRVGAVYYPATTTTKIKKFDAPLVYTKTAADELASALYDMLTLGCFKYRFRSAVAAGIGTYYTVADTTLNISTTTRITKRTTTQILGTEYYEYEAEGAGEISTLTTETQIATVAAPTTPPVIQTPEVVIEIGELPDGEKEVWLQFEGDVTDSSGNGTDGTAYGTPTYTEGRIEQAIELDGATQYVTLPYTVGDALLTEAGTAFSFGCFFRFDDTRTEMALVSKDSDLYPLARVGIGYIDFSILYAEAGKYYLYFDGNDLAISSATSDTFLQPETWYHACFTWDGTTATLYVDGLAVGTDTSPAGYLDDNNAVQIGRRILGAIDSLYFNGLIDELLIYQGALSSDEVYALARTSLITITADAIGPKTNPGLVKMESDKLIIDGELKTQYITGPAPLFGVRAWVNFDGTTADNEAATYSRTGTTVTVTLAAHGYLTGHVVYCNFTSGGALDGTYTITGVPTADTFTLTTAASGSIAAGSTLELNRRLIRASGNVHSVSYRGTGLFAINFRTAMPDDNYACGGAVSREAVTAGATQVPDTLTAAAYTFSVRDVSNGVRDGAVNTIFIVR